MTRSKNTADTNGIDIALLQKDISWIRDSFKDLRGDIEEIKKKLEADFATKEWCESHYGETTKQVKVIIGTILLAVLGAIMSLVIKK